MYRESVCRSLLCKQYYKWSTWNAVCQVVSDAVFQACINTKGTLAWLKCENMLASVSPCTPRWQPVYRVVQSILEFWRYHIRCPLKVKVSVVFDSLSTSSGSLVVWLRLSHHLRDLRSARHSLRCLELEIRRLFVITTNNDNEELNTLR